MHLNLKHVFTKLIQVFAHVPLVVRYGLILAVGIILLKTLEYQLFSYRFNIELYTGLIALFFMIVGLAAGLGWLHSKKLTLSNTQQSPSAPLTAKERKLLAGLTQGLTNQQLAEAHFVSVNTIKTHLKNVYKKLEVSNRAEAVAKAKELDLN